MRTISIPLTLVILLLTAPSNSSLAQLAQPVPWHPCAQITATCTQAGFVPNGAKRGLGIMLDCIRPIMIGTPQRKQATKALPQIDPQVVEACRQRNPNFGKGGRAKSQPSESGQPATKPSST
jgi:hypothetical protein